MGRDEDSLGPVCVSKIFITAIILFCVCIHVFADVSGMYLCTCGDQRSPLLLFFPEFHLPCFVRQGPSLVPEAP